MFTTLEGGVDLVFAPNAYVRTSLGGGVARRLLFSVEPASGSMFSSSYAFAHTRQYAEAALELMFDPGSIRRDRHHLLGLDARVYGPPHEGEQSALHLAGWYQKMFPFGWNELWFEARGISRTGFILFPEEASIGGSVLRGPFSNEYARKYAACSSSSAIRCSATPSSWGSSTTWPGTARSTGSPRKRSSPSRTRSGSASTPCSSTSSSSMPGSASAGRRKGCSTRAARWPSGKLFNELPP